MNEADTCRKYVVPRLETAGWDDAPHSFTEQRTFTDGRIVTHGQKATRRPGKRADFLLRYARDFTIAVVEAKAEFKQPADGLQQSKDYARILGLRFAYSTNGHGIVEFDFITGLEREMDSFPSPAELWSRLRAAEHLTDDATAERLLTPANFATGKEPRYYQQIAINQAAQSVLTGKRRVLLTMATGTGKTVVAFQICWKLWTSKWNAKGDPTRRPRILYLADRNFLVDDPKDKTFSAFGDARWKIEGGTAPHSRELYFATYQSIAKDERRPGLYKQFAPDFFDLIIVDECHRGSANEDSNWREILEYFQPAYQLGMTATPLRDENRDTYLYFGNPIYTYSLKQGIDDGFLAPYRVHRIVTQWDAAGWRPSKDELDRFGRAIPDEEYHTADFERVVSLRARTQAIARHLTDFLKKTDRFAKTIVFCVDQEHASEMRAALNNLNSDLAQQFPDYACRVTADEGDIGRGHMQRFQDVETRTPVILTTSQLLTTGLDAPTCRNVVLVRLVNSMVEFKQIIGRGTRLFDGKDYFTIYDFVKAHLHFSDPEWDGEPLDPISPIAPTPPIPPTSPPEPPTGPPPPRQKVRVKLADGNERAIQHMMATTFWHPDGTPMSAQQFMELLFGRLPDFFQSEAELRALWSAPDTRAKLLQGLADKDFGYDKLVAMQQLIDAEKSDLFDVLAYVAYALPPITREVRAAHARVHINSTFNAKQQAFLEFVLSHYVREGVEQLKQENLNPLLLLKYQHSITDAVADLGGRPEEITRAFAGFQKHLYA